METCKFCGEPLAGQYYRVASEMGCVPCGKRIGDEATRDEGKESLESDGPGGDHLLHVFCLEGDGTPRIAGRRAI